MSPLICPGCSAPLPDAVPGATVKCRRCFQEVQGVVVPSSLAAQGGRRRRSRLWLALWLLVMLGALGGALAWHSWPRGPDRIYEASYLQQELRADPVAFRRAFDGKKVWVRGRVIDVGPLSVDNRSFVVTLSTEGQGWLRAQFAADDEGRFDGLMLRRGRYGPTPPIQRGDEITVVGRVNVGGVVGEDFLFLADAGLR
jgi:hypothetical protein